MSEELAITSENNNISSEVDLLFDFKKSVDENSESAILCEAKENNPNYLSIIHANKKFCETFNITTFNLIGKSCDFLFEDIDVDYSSDNELEYIRLIKDIKDFHACSVIISLPSRELVGDSARFKINFNPIDSAEKKSRHAIFTFEKMEIANDENRDGKKQNIILLKNLERSLRSERLLREVGYLIISDIPIRDVAQNIAKILCDYLKADRCILHDYHEGETKFFVEYHNNYTKPMVKEVSDEESLTVLAKYVNFQNHFYEKYGNKNKTSFLTAIEDVALDSNFTTIEQICHDFFIASQIAVTTSFNDKLNGGIYIHQAVQRNWLPDEMELVETVADQFSIALDRSSSLDKVMVANHALMEKTLQLKDALKEEQKIRKMQNEFVALVSHEFKTPLQIIDSTRELLSRKLKNLNVVDESVDKSLDRIKSGIQRMNGLIHTTLNLAKMESGSAEIKVEYQIFDLKKFIYEIIEKNSNLATNKNIKVLTRIDDLPTSFNGDAKLLDHSITNIISNAIKYSRNDTVVKILATSSSKRVALRIIDQGIGIPKDDLSSVGTKFFRAKNTLSVAGTGIGLYLTKHFIELHGGNVVIESDVNVGTSVTVTLPVKEIS